MADRWATFDCYGTLIDWNGGIGAALAAVFGEDDGSLLRYHELEPVVEAERYRTYREVLDTVLALLAEERGFALAEQQRTALSRSLPDWPAFPDVPNGLREARRRGWRLAALSNCDRDLLEASIERLGVPFDHVVVAQDVRSYTPAHAHWERFFTDTGARRSRHVHVAQSLFHDIVPCRELGLRSVWINRLGEAPGPEPDRELPDLTGLADALDGLVAA